MGSKITPEKKIAFLAALAATGNVTKSAKAVGVERQTVYTWREEDADFAAAWEKAMQLGVEAMEDECKRRAFDGVDKPVFYQGGECGTVREYSDTLAIFLLKAHAPEKYRERSNVELTGKAGGPIEITETERAKRIAALFAEVEKQGDDTDASDLV